jgi:hypothetical protein
VRRPGCQRATTRPAGRCPVAIANFTPTKRWTACRAVKCLRCCPRSGAIVYRTRWDCDACLIVQNSTIVPCLTPPRKGIAPDQQVCPKMGPLDQSYG